MLMVWPPSGHALQQWEEKVNVKKKTKTWKKNKQINSLPQTDLQPYPAPEVYGLQTSLG